MVDINSEYARAMIRDFIKIQKDILGLPNLTTKQKDDINSLGHELSALSSQADDDKIKTGLIDMMNRLDKEVSLRWWNKPEVQFE